MSEDTVLPRVDASAGQIGALRVPRSKPVRQTLSSSSASVPPAQNWASYPAAQAGPSDDRARPVSVATPQPVVVQPSVAVAVTAPAVVQRQPAIVQPLVVGAEGATAAPQYVSVGPEYFGEDSDIAPFVISRAGEPSYPGQSFAQAVPIPRPQEIPQGPQPGLVAQTFVPPRPPSPPQRTPQNPVPLAPQRVAALVPSGVVSDAGVLSAAPRNGWEPVAVTRTPEPAVAVQVSSAGADFDRSRAQDVRTSSISFSTPDNLVESMGDAGAPVQAAGPAPATPTVMPEAAASEGCLVNRGPDNRIILVCDGLDVSTRDALRAVIEGESALRALRSFDTDDRAIEEYGFNAARYHAITRGPRSEQDLSFLRATRKTARRTTLKGRRFDVYVMQGDRRLATVLVESL